MGIIVCALCSFYDLNKIIYINTLVSCLTHNFVVYYYCCNNDDVDFLSRIHYVKGDRGELSR